MLKKPFFSFILFLAALSVFFMSTDTGLAIERRTLEKDNTTSRKLHLREKFFSIGKGHFDRGEYEEAIAAFRAVLDLDKDSIDIKRYIKLAQYNINKRFLEERVLSRTNGGTREKDSGTREKDIRAVYRLGLEALKDGQHHKAIGYFQQLLSMDPGHEGATSKLAEARMALAKEKRGAGGPMTPEEAPVAAESGFGVLEESYYDEEARFSGRLTQREKDIQRDVLIKKILMKRMKEKTAGVEAARPQAPKIWEEPREASGVRSLSRKEILKIKKRARKKELMAKLAKKKTAKKAKNIKKPIKDNGSIALKAKKIMRQEKEKRTIIEKRRRKELDKIYSRSEEMLKRGYYDPALNGFKKIAKDNIEFKNTKQYIAKIRNVEESKKRDTQPPPYTLGPDDTLEITVVNHPEFSGRVTVEPGGEIILPLSKEVINVNGMTKEALSEDLTKRLGKFVKSPEITIVITGYNSKKWYILGEIGVRGEYSMGKTNLTLLEALYQARLPLENTAAMRRVALIRPHRTRPKQKWINVYELLYEGKLKHNVRIEPGDIIYVPKTVVNKFSTVISQATQPFTDMSGGLTDINALSTTLKAVTPLKYMLTPRDKQ
ncbi:polysaccharide biosynthesis/export family protein [Candidatus Omnitrophota bacterium]